MKNNTTLIIFSNQLLIDVFEEILNSFKFSLKMNYVISNNELIEKYEKIVCDKNTLTQISNELNDRKKIYVLTNQVNEINKSNYNSNITFLAFPIKLTSLFNMIENDFSQEQKNNENLIKFKNLIYDPFSRFLFKGEKSMRLTEKESDIFLYLFKMKKTGVSKKDLLQNVWNYDDQIDTHTLETHIYSLRKKIKKNLDIENLIYTDESHKYKLNFIEN